MSEKEKTSLSVSGTDFVNMRQVSCRELFLSFLGVGLIGFGGVMPWIRRMIVEKKQWLSEEDFVNMLSVSQILPGANVGNLAVCLGSRFAGLRGALSALAGLYCAPFCIVILLAMFYSSIAHLQLVENIFRGISAVAAGIVIAMGIKIMMPVCRTPHAIIIALLAFSGIVIFRFSLIWIVVFLAPMSILALLWLQRE